jgi:hypothetical protein
MQLITGKVSEISRGASKTKPKSKDYKITIGETEITVDRFASKKISVGDEIAALVEGNINGTAFCISFRNLTRNVSIPSPNEADIALRLGGLAILIGIMGFLFSPLMSTGGIITVSGIIALSHGFQARRVGNLLDAEIARQESQAQEQL